VLVLLGRVWDTLSLKDKRRCIQATIAQAVVTPAEKGTRPEERITVTYHDLAPRLLGKTPPLPTELS
jgi:hypothetical protein